jgi:uncharacterized membrane protein
VDRGSDASAVGAMTGSALSLLWFVVPNLAVIVVIAAVIALWYAWRRRREAMPMAPMPVARVHRAGPRSIARRA